MTDSRPDLLRQLFDRAIDLPAAQRPRFLAGVCGSDVDLERRLLAMLAAAEDEHFLVDPTGLAAAGRAKGAPPSDPALHHPALPVPAGTDK